MNGMKLTKRVAAGLVTGLLLAPAALAQSNPHDHGAGQPSQPSADAAPPVTGGRPGGPAGKGMMGMMPGMMGSGGTMGMMRPGTMGLEGMASGMAETDMMHRMMAMMHPNMMQGLGERAGAAMAGGGMRVTPVQHLTEDDVRHFFEHWLERQGNGRLKVGTVQQADGDAITADVVTVDDSLVQRYRIDRHSGEVSIDRS